MKYIFYQCILECLNIPLRTPSTCCQFRHESSIYTQSYTGIEIHYRDTWNSWLKGYTFDTMLIKVFYIYVLFAIIHPTFYHVRLCKIIISKALCIHLIFSPRKRYCLYLFLLSTLCLLIYTTLTK